MGSRVWHAEFRPEENKNFSRSRFTTGNDSAHLHLALFCLFHHSCDIVMQYKASDIDS